MTFFVATDAELAVADYRGVGNSMNPDQASEYVMRQMIDQIESSRSHVWQSAWRLGLRTRGRDAANGFASPIR